MVIHHLPMGIYVQKIIGLAVDPEERLLYFFNFLRIVQLKGGEKGTRYSEACGILYHHFGRSEGRFQQELRGLH